MKVLAAILGIALLLSACQRSAGGPNSADRNADVATVEQTSNGDAAPAGYEVVDRETRSLRALAKPLSSYASDELLGLPFYQTTTVSAAISGNITQAQVGPTLNAIVEAVTASSPETDELVVFLYSDPELVHGATGYDIG